MVTLKLGATGKEVATLQNLLNRCGCLCTESGIFDGATEKAVRQFQSSQGLSGDGIVGANTWKVLENMASLRLCEMDFVEAARKLDIEVAALKAVQEVETGGRGGFIKADCPVILFEGHIFWNELEKRGVKPKDIVSGNEDILYPKWTRQYYKSGMAEYARLERASLINETAALCSASWGMWQIMGFNHEACGCKDVREFIRQVKVKERTQLDLFVTFLQSNGWDKQLRGLDWAGFARLYNGPAYKVNKYDEKLAAAYRKHL